MVNMVNIKKEKEEGRREEEERKKRGEPTMMAPTEKN